MLSEEILVKLGLDKSSFDMGLKRAEGALGIFKRAISAIGIGISGAFVGSSIRSLMTYAGTIKDLSEQTGLSTAFIQKFRNSVEDSGGTADGASDSLARLAAKIGDARSGNKEAAQSFYNIGIGFRHTDGTARSLESIIDDISNVMKNTANETDRAAIAMDLFGRAGKDLINTLSGQDYKNASNIISDTQLTALDRADKMLSKIGRDAKVWGTTFLESFYWPIKGFLFGQEKTVKEFNDAYRKMYNDESARKSALNASKNKLVEIGQTKQAEESAKQAAKEKLEIEKKITEEKQKQNQKQERITDLIKQLVEADKRVQSAERGLGESKSDRYKFTLAEIASGSPSRSWRVNADIMAARRVQLLEMQGKIAAGAYGREDVASRLFNQADTIRATIGGLVTSERFPWRSMDENIADLKTSANRIADAIKAALDKGYVNG